MAEPGGDHGDWGNLRFGPRDRLARTAEEASEARFRIGLGAFVLVALLYPWYEYWVQTRLLARDVTQAMQTVGDAFEKEAAVAEREPAANAQPPRRQARPVYGTAVRTMGAMRTRSGPMVIVDLDGRSLEDARPAICAQAAEWLGEPVQGRMLRVQRYRSNRPAISVGMVRC